MKLTAKLRSIALTFGKPAISIYPIIIIVLIPLLLVINTVWNLRSFTRDANFIVRHQAISVAETLGPYIKQNISDPNSIYSVLTETKNSNSEIISATLLQIEGKNTTVITSTATGDESEKISELGLNKLATSFDQSFAGLTYDPIYESNVWNVVVPLEGGDANSYLLALKLKTDTVNELLSRTSRDSFIILIILVIVSLILLVNHVIFYRRSLKTKQLEELDKLKDEFVSMASHELQAPVTGLTGYLEMLEEKLAGINDEEVKSDINTLKMLTYDLKKLIEDLLNVSRIEQGRIKVTVQEANINDIVQKVIDTLKHQAQEKNLAINFSPVELPMIQSDPDRIRQVVANLISNSIKYTLQGKVGIQAVHKDKFIEIKVSDTGIGIPPTEKEKLFSKFHRVKDKKTIEVRGTGLGLWITKQIVELLGGKIFVESIYGTGTTITFTLPIAPTG